MPRPVRNKGSSPNLEKAADRGSIGSKTSPRRIDLTKPEVQSGGLGVTVSREYDNAFPGITNKESVTVGFDDIVKGNNISGGINPQEKSGSLSIGLGTKKIGGNISIEIDFRNGWVPNIAIDFGAKIAGIGGNLGVNTRGGAKVGVGLGPGSIEIAIDKQGNKSATFCYGVPGFEVCNEYSRTKKDPQPKPTTPRSTTPKPASVAKPAKPKRPKLPIAKPRTKPKPKPKPKPSTRPITPKPPTAIKPKRPVPAPKLPTPPIPKPPTAAKRVPPKRPISPPKPPTTPKIPRPNPWPSPTPTPTPPGNKTFLECYPLNTQHNAYVTRSVSGADTCDNPQKFSRGSETRKTATRPGVDGISEVTTVYRQWHNDPNPVGTPPMRTPYDITYPAVITREWNFYPRMYSDTIISAVVTEGQPGIAITEGAIGTTRIGWGGTEYGVLSPPPGCPTTPNETPPTPTPTPVDNFPKSSGLLPNKPTTIKPMDCCKEIKEIHKYLGIAKIKKNKFKVAKAFMVPGGTGNEECEDYYQLQQAMIRMLANGLIINPISKPLGSEWKSVNATAWAGQIYEMAAEAMSNGNSSQKYEISMMMQITQLLSILSEQTRKIEFLSEVLGVEPDLDTEELVACFTIYEGHKGFEKKEPKKIDIGKAKTDDDVEAILGKMLQPSKIPITKWVLKPESKSIVEILLDQ